MDDLAVWLGQQFDEDERIARAVGVPHDWHQGPGDDPEWTDEALVCMWPPEFHTPYEEDKHWRGLTVAEGAELAAFIAAHDPARVLREIDAKRQIIAEHTVTETNEFEGKTATVTYCPLCRNDGDCPTLRLLALPYADRPGYREEWCP